MRKLILLCAWVSSMACSLNPAAAQNDTSFVSHSGSDSNNCTSQSPCLTFANAFSKTNAYGEIDCLDGGVYAFDVSQLYITRSVTIDCAGSVGSATTYSPIVVDGSGVVVRLRNLTLNGIGAGDEGIDVLNAAALYVENCVITNFNASGVSVTPYIGIKFEPSTNAQLFVANSIISNNGYSRVGGITGGIYVVPGSGVTAQVSIDHSKINGNVFGVVGDGSSGGIIKATISNSVVSGNSEDGIAAISSGSAVWFLVDQTEVSGNAYGLAAGGSGTEILASNSSVFGNTTGLHTSNGGALYSYGNNRLNGNTTNGTFTGTVGLQ